MDFLSVKLQQAHIQSLKNKEWQEKNISCSMLRLDELDVNISGNKLFKLYYFLQQAIAEKKSIVTFGGAWSNHLAATASACKKLNIKCIGIVRGEKPFTLSSTLLFCIQNGMDIKFVNRDLYGQIKWGNTSLQFSIDENIVIPEGGYSGTGAKGAALIRKYFSGQGFTHVCIPVGTATSFAGLMSNDDCSYLGFAALKNLSDAEERIKYLSPNVDLPNYTVVKDYHFGGYAKYNDMLIQFINNFYKTYSIPLDFVYTGKMMYGISEMITANYFNENSRILCIHTGGLQGNMGLPKNTLVF